MNKWEKTIFWIIIVTIGILLIGSLLGFDFRGSFASLLLIATLTSISIIAFSLILAALTKTVSEVLIVGNFPLFLFMFFTGAAFPLEAKELFTIAGYSVSFPGLMSPSHAIIALRKILILDMELKDVVPEIIAVILLTIIYFLIGFWYLGFQDATYENGIMPAVRQGKVLRVKCYTLFVIL